MPGRIPKSFIDNLLGRVDIIDVIDTDVPLKKTGRDFQALCPFHNEKTPSFTVSQEKQFYHCFGCGAHGSAIGFLMNYRNFEFVEAVEELAAQAGIEVPREGRDFSREPDYGAVYEALANAQQYYARQLTEHPERRKAVDYLKKRGLTGQIAKTFGIGFAPAGWDNLSRAWHQNQKALETAGLVINKNDGGVYDRFRERIIFPIEDRRGRVIGFGGRIIDAGEPKYMNSPETPVFQKRRELYGLYQAKQHDSKPARMLVVEGYMDVLALAQHDIHNVVATLGTATTHEHLEQLFRVTPEIVFCFDGDKAGRHAASRALETSLGFLQAGRQISFLFMPEGEDPDSLVHKEGVERFRDRAALTPLSQFLLDGLARKTDLTSRDGRARLIEIAKPQIEKIPAGAFRDLLIDELEKKSWTTQTEISMLRSRHPAARTAGAKGRQRASRSAEPVPLVTVALTLLIKKPEFARLVGDATSIIEPDSDDAVLFVDVINLLQANPHLSPGATVEHWRGAASHERLGQLLAHAIETPEDGLEAEFTGAIERLRARSARRKRPVLDDTRPGAMSDEEKEQLRKRYPGKR